MLRRVLTKSNLIPRYNWQYDAMDCGIVLKSVFSSKRRKIDAFSEISDNEQIFSNSGRASIYAILKSLNLPPGSKVGVPLFCCPVVFDAITKAGLIPEFIDISLADFCLSVDDLNRKKERIKALIVVHMFGNPADMDKITSIVKDIPVIEDCAQSLFTSYKGKYTGTLSEYSFFSFRSGKYLSAGEGSLIFINDAIQRRNVLKIVDQFPSKKIISEILEVLSVYIKTKFYNRPLYGIIGYPLGRQLDKKMNLTAKDGFSTFSISKTHLALIAHRMKSIKKRIAIQRQVTRTLMNLIDNKKIAMSPFDQGYAISNCYQFAIRFENMAQRDKVADFLFLKGIDSAKYCDEVPGIVKSGYSYKGDCPNADIACETVLIIPNHYYLSKDDINHIASSLNIALNQL